MDRNFVIAMILMVAVLFAWQMFFAPAPQQPQDMTPAGEPSATPAAAPAPPPAAPAAAPPPAQAPPPAAPAPGEPPAAPASDEPAAPAPAAVEPKTWTVDGPLIRAELSNGLAGGILKWDLSNYFKTTADKNKPAAERALVDLAPYQRPYENKRAEPRKFSDQPQLVCALHNAKELDGAQAWELVERTPDHQTLRRAAGPLTVTKTLRFRAAGRQPLDLPYNVDVEMEVANAGTAPATVQPFCAVYEQVVPDTSSFFYRDYNQMLQVSDVEGSLKAQPIAKAVAKGVDQAPTFWTGFADNYFAQLVAPDDETIKVQGARAQLRTAGENILEARLLAEPFALGPNQSKKVVFKTYLGPKDRNFIAAGDNGPKYHLDRSIDFGWFDIIAQWLMWGLVFFAKLTGNYGVAILIVTVIIKILLFPLQHKSFKSMKEMQLLQPEIAKLREKYKDNKEKLNQEMMALYRAHKVNPAGGCLPMLAQLPIFIAFYRALGYSIELRHTPFVWWLQDLSAQDPYYITPILMGVTMFVSQKMTPTSADPAQARVMQLMPIMFTFLFLSFPAGLVLYWLTNNILSIAQQAITNKYLLPAPAPIAAPPARTGGKKQDG